MKPDLTAQDFAQLTGLGVRYVRRACRQQTSFGSGASKRDREWFIPWENYAAYLRQREDLQGRAPTLNLRKMITPTDGLTSRQHSIRRLWRLPGYREKQRQGREDGRSKKSAAMKQRWQDPEYRERQRAARAARKGEGSAP